MKSAIQCAAVLLSGVLPELICTAKQFGYDGVEFDGNISIEYERDWENTVPDIAQCVGYVRGFADAENKP